MRKPTSHKSKQHALLRPPRKNPDETIPHSDALQLILSNISTRALQESIQAELRAIGSHWLQAPETEPVFFDKGTGETWKALLSKHPTASLSKSGEGLLPTNQPDFHWNVDFNGVPFPPVEHPQFTFIDLFAGIGGFRIALQSLGGKCVFSSEWDRHAQHTYQKNFGEVPFGDIRIFTGDDVSDEQIAKWIPDHDVLAAGFPCQPFSKAGVSARNSLGRKHGFSCEIQGTLFFDLVRIAKEKRPKVLLLENVKHLQRHDEGRTFKKIEETIRKDLGYSFSPGVLDSSSLVAQRRHRCYIVCFRDPGVAFSFPSFTGKPKSLGSILLKKDPGPRYTITDRLWTGHKNRTERNLKRGTGFTAFLANPDRPANTLVARYYKDGKECLVAQPGKNPRKLTPREFAKLQGFPKKFILSKSDTQAYKQLGNSVVIPVIKRIAKKIIPKLEKPS